ncbi:hypothetical protein [Leptospira kanakyensis]|uniref:hypothetical protein n=1 Tax=Leptospira kanakyensis TaxID=2484968 RepID=UPI00223E0891|nr:hypothetical protein [Leptospira kanakyensis]MCW7471799.1 hypothetical protein [Leptospira kanakyensis]MCW7483241.1 hypothetical protein [Leptospira kanakyensis]
MENPVDIKLNTLLKSISDLPEKFDENTITTIKKSLNSNLSYIEKNIIALSIIKISFKIYQTKRFISKPIRDIFFVEFQNLCTFDASKDEDIKTYFISTVTILLNLVPKKVDPCIDSLLKETKFRNNKILIVQSIFKTFNETARSILSTKLEFGKDIYKFEE